MYCYESRRAQSLIPAHIKSKYSSRNFRARSNVVQQAVHEFITTSFGTLTMDAPGEVIVKKSSLRRLVDV